MSVNTRNIIILIVAVLVGLVIGFNSPSIAMLLIIPVILFVIFVFMRNKSGGKAGAEELAAAMSLTPAAGKARIYVMRNAFVAGQQGMNIDIGPQLNTQIRTKHFVMAQVEPGTHQVEAHMSSQTKSTAVLQEVTLADGECVLLDAKIKMGALQGSVLMEEFRDAAEIEQRLSGMKLVLWKEFKEPASATAKG